MPFIHRPNEQLGGVATQLPFIFSGTPNIIMSVRGTHTPSRRLAANSHNAEKGRLFGKKDPRKSETSCPEFWASHTDKFPSNRGIALRYLSTWRRRRRAASAATGAPTRIGLVQRMSCFGHAYRPLCIGVLLRCSFYASLHGCPFWGGLDWFSIWQGHLLV